MAEAARCEDGSIFDQHKAVVDWMSTGCERVEFKIDINEFVRTTRLVGWLMRMNEFKCYDRGLECHSLSNAQPLKLD